MKYLNFPLIIICIALFAFLSVYPMCNSIPERDLHACFWTLKDSSLFSKSVGDSARIKAVCDPIRRQELVFLLCNITINETGNLVRPALKDKIAAKGCTNAEIKKYIETGAY